MASGTNIGQAYVKIMPSMDGMKKNLLSVLNKDAGDAGKESGKSMGAGIVSSLKSTIVGLIAAAGIGKIISESFMAGADLEQQLGGIKTLFKDSYDTVVNYANNAYKDIGMSANQYMSLATSFSAKLLQGLGDDTAKAAEYANMAMTDMADNANKMGTDMESITYAYQGFAKDNYEMLDNLKLGYGGTQAEMARLINESGVLGDSVKVTAESVKDVPFDKVIEAIHVIQKNLGITGTSALEAKETFTGSFNSMKAAAENFLAAFMMNGKDGVDITPALEGLITTTSTFVFGNALPAIGRMITSLITIIPQLIVQGIPTLMEGATQYFNSISTALSNLIINLPILFQTYLPVILQAGLSLFQNLITGFLQGLPLMVTYIGQFVTSIINTLMLNYPQFLEQGMALVSQLINGIFLNMPNILSTMSQMIQDLITLLVNALPDFFVAGVDIIAQIIVGLLEQMPNIISTLGDILQKLIEEIMKKYPDYLEKGFEIIQKIIDGIIQNGPSIISTLVTTLLELIATIGEHLPEFLQKGIELIGEFASGIIEGIPDLLAQIPGALVDIGEAFLSYDWLGIGMDIISGIGNGIANAVTGLVNSAIQACGKLVDSVKSFFGIASPSKLMAKQVGKFLPPGIGNGVIDNMDAAIKPVEKMNQAIEDAVKPDLSKSVAVTAAASIKSGRKFVDGSTAEVKNYGGVTIMVNAKDGKSAREIAKEVKKILVTDEEIERRGKLA